MGHHHYLDTTYCNRDLEWTLVKEVRVAIDHFCKWAVFFGAVANIYLNLKSNRQTVKSS